MNDAPPVESRVAPPAVAGPAPAATRRRLAVRLAWLTVAAILLADAMFFIPSLVRQRGEWLDRRLAEAQLAALSAGVAPNGVVDLATRDALLRLAGAEAIRIERPGGHETVLAATATLPDVPRLDLPQETFLAAVGATAATLFDGADTLVAVEGASPLPGDASVIAVLHLAPLHRALVQHARRIGLISLAIAAATGVLLFGALLELLVRPMRRLTESIAAFRADPERCAPLDEAGFAGDRGDEISEAGRELAAMQRELRAALWRNARLAALGTAMAKISHDLRGILSPAMLTAERLQMNADPAVKRAGDVLVRTVERATELTRRTLEFTREMPMELPRLPMELRAAVEEAAEQARAACPGLIVANLVTVDIEVEADHESIVRVFGNLLRNAGEAEARRVAVTAVREAGELAIVVADNGPGLPEAVRAALFRPFVVGARRGSTGLGLAIVHDLMRAHGGDAVLLETGAGGTRFRLTLPERALLSGAPAPLSAAAAR